MVDFPANQVVVAQNNPGVGTAQSLPRSIPHDPDAAHVRHAHVMVDASADGIELKPIWKSIGFDEINWTYTPTGKRLLGRFEPGFHVRPHYVFISGTGFGLPHWGSGNVYHERDDGTPFYDFAVVDDTY